MERCVSQVVGVAVTVDADEAVAEVALVVDPRQRLLVRRVGAEDEPARRALDDVVPVLAPEERARRVDLGATENAGAQRLRGPRRPVPTSADPRPPARRRSSAGGAP